MPSSSNTDGQSAVSIPTEVKDANPLHAQTVSLNNLWNKNLPEEFTVDDFTHVTAKVRAAFYPKFNNDGSVHDVRTRMIEAVSKGKATLEVSLKHSGSLFMYAGDMGGAYAKNSFGNIYTAAGVFVLGRTFRQAWGAESSQKQSEFNEFLEQKHMSISMELVTAVLGDHGQRPRKDYVVVTAVTEFGNGKPLFYSTPEIISFCRNWRLPTNHIWLFSTRDSVTNFFAAYDALREEGTATSVCKALDSVADIFVPGSVDHINVQGEILEGLVARIVSPESTKQMERISKDYRSPAEEADLAALQDLGPSLREIFAANSSDERINALIQHTGTSFCSVFVDWCGIDDVVLTKRAAESLVTKFLQAKPSDYSSTKLMEMVRLMREKLSRDVTLKCHPNYRKINSISGDNLHFKMVIQGRRDSAFSQYQEDMRSNPGLWPLYRGFFVEINLFKASEEEAAGIAKACIDIGNKSKESGSEDEDTNLMIKLKFLPYKLRTFLIRNGLSSLFGKGGRAAYKKHYQRQMDTWDTSTEKRRQLSEMLEEWAEYITRKFEGKQPSASLYLSEAEPFLKEYANRNPENLALIGYAVES